MNTRIFQRINCAAIVAATAAFSFATSAMAASFQARQSDLPVLPLAGGGETTTEIITVNTLTASSIATCASAKSNNRVTFYHLHDAANERYGITRTTRNR